MNSEIKGEICVLTKIEIYGIIRIKYCMINNLAKKFDSQKEVFL